jgi:hypothetical protein
MPYLSRHGMASQIADQPEALYRQAANRALSDCEDAQAEAAVMTLLRLVNGSYARAQNQLADMLGKRDQWMGSLLPFLAGEDDAEADHAARDILQAALNDLVQQETHAALARLTPLTRILNEAVALARVAQANGAKGLEGVAGRRFGSVGLEDTGGLAAHRKRRVAKENEQAAGRSVAFRGQGRRKSSAPRVQGAGGSMPARSA